MAMPRSIAAGIAILMAASVLWTVVAMPAYRYAEGTAMQLVQPRLYVDAVMQAAPVPAPLKGH